MSHVMMKKSLAKALMESGMHDVSDEHVQKFGLGGVVSSIFGGGGGGSAKSDYAPPPIVKQNFLPQISTLQGNQAQTYGQQQNLAKTLLDQSNGSGPNPAQAQFNQNTAANVANQAALAAGQRGASANVGAIQRQNANMGAGVQQQAVGQEATLDAEQRLAAQQQLQKQYSDMANQSLTGEQIQQTGQAAQNNAINTGGLGTNQINSAAELANQTANNNITGGFLSSLGTVLPGIAKGVGGLFSGAASALGPMAGGLGDAVAGGAGGLGATIEGAGPAAALVAYDGGEIPKKSFSRALLDGGKVPGKAKVEGNSLKNDTEKTLLSPGEVVLPRSVTQSPDAAKKAEEFMKHIQDEDQKKNGKGYAGVISAKKSLKDRVEHLEKMCMGGYARGA